MGRVWNIGVAMVDRSQPSLIADESGGTNATWRSTLVKKSRGRLSQEDLARIRAEAIEFIGQSGMPEDARIEWLLTFPPRGEPIPNSKRSRNQSRIFPFGHKLEATEVGDVLRKASGVPGLDAVVNSMFEYEGRRPRALRNLLFSAISPGYIASLRIGGPSWRSPHITLACETLGTEVPEFFISVAKLLNKRANSLAAMARLSVWFLVWLFIVLLPSAVVPIFYTHFRQAKDRSNIVGGAVWAAIGYLVAVAIIVGVSRRINAARVTLPRAGRMESLKSAFLRRARDLAWSDRSTFGPITRHLALAGGSLAGAGLAAMLAYIVATASTNVKDTPTWPYLLFGALIVVGTSFYLIGVARFRREPQEKSENTP
jgi:hypothetical protein